ncbi:MAG: LysM peptidoglycan-binding domain-containing protein [Verrucomicrobiaceae bacterium]|nr:MAG: LysM peptidoglycan-binding domain-containing protein [Verrucomicrobiaceae bacterium]
MQSRWLLLPAASLSLFLASCANNGGATAGNNPQGLGPFDSRGNYVEAWADSPSQWKKGSSSQIADAQPDRAASNDIPVSPEFVKVEEVPGNAVPYQQGPTSTPVVYKKPTTTAVTRATPERTVAKNTPKPSSTTKSTTKSKSSSAVAKSTPKPKATVKKELVKSKPKAKSSSHTVKSGDNLYNIAKRYGTSVAAIQKANGSKGSMIRPGQSLVIPR